MVAEDPNVQQEGSFETMSDELFKFMREAVWGDAANQILMFCE